MKYSFIFFIFMFFILSYTLAAENWSTLGAAFSYQFHYYDLEIYEESREYLDLGLEYKGYWGQDWGVAGRFALYYPLWFIRTNSLGYNQGTSIKEMKNFLCFDVIAGPARQWHNQQSDLEWGLDFAYKQRQIKQSFTHYEDRMFGLGTHINGRWHPSRKSGIYLYSSLGGYYYPLIFSRELDIDQRLFTGQAVFSLGLGWDS